jgi:CBS domain-containing protein
MKKMPTYAKDIMTTELILGHPRMTIEEAIKTLVNNRITGMPVVDENRRLIGVVSEYHIIKSVESTKKSRPINLGQTINYSSKVITPPRSRRSPRRLSFPRFSGISSKKRSADSPS